MGKEEAPVEKTSIKINSGASLLGNKDSAPDDEPVEIISSGTTAEDTIHKFKKGEVTIGADSETVRAGIGARKFLPGDNGEENLKAGVVFDGERLEPFVGVKISQNLSKELGIERKDLSAEIKVEGAISPGDPSYLVSSAGLSYNRAAADEHPIHSGEVKLVGGLHDDEAFAGVEGGLRYDIHGLESGDVCYAFGKASFLTTDTNMENTHMGGGVGFEVDNLRRKLDIRSDFNKISFEVGMQHNTEDCSLPRDVDMGPKGSSVFFQINISP